MSVSPNSPLPQPPGDGQPQAPVAGQGIRVAWQAKHPRLDRAIHLFWREWIRPFLVILVVMGSFRSVVADWNHVPTGSMKPTILVGDRILVNKLAYDLKVPFTRLRVATWANPKHGDLIVFRSADDRKRLVKRVIGLPGDWIKMEDNYLVVNGERAQWEPLESDLIVQVDQRDRGEYEFWNEHIGELVHPIMISHFYSRMPSFEPLRVPADRYFVLGDNRDNSQDSRFFGFVNRERILGRATAVAISVDPDRFYLPRWQRFFSNLP